MAVEPNNVNGLAWAPPRGMPGTARDVVCLAGLGLIGVALQLLELPGLAVVLLIAAAAIAVLSPLAAVVAIPAALPWIAMPVRIGRLDFSLLELAIAVAAFGVGVHLLEAMARARSFAPLLSLGVRWTVTAAAAALVLAGAISLTTVADVRHRPESLRALRWTILEPVAALLLFRWVIRRGERRLLIAAMIGGAGVAALIALAQIALGRGVVIADGVQRATGPYTHPNNLSFLLERAVVLMLAIGIAYGAGRRWLWIVVGVIAAGLVATLSRGAIAGVAVGGGWVLLSSPWRRHWRRVLPGALLLLAGLAAVAGRRLLDRGGAGTESSRELIWHASIRMIDDHPWTGVGLDQFLAQYNSRYVAPAGWAERYTSHPHNLVLDVWLSLGVAGLAAAVVIAGVVGVLATRPVPAFDPIRVGAIGALAAGLTHGMVDNGYFLADLALMFWLLVALIEPMDSVSGAPASG